MAIGILSIGMALVRPFITLGKAVSNLVTEHPGKVAVAAVVAVAGYGVYTWGYNRGVESTQAEVEDLRKKLNEQIALVTERNLRLGALERESEVRTAANKEALSLLSGQLTTIVSSYERNLKAAMLNPTVVTRTITVQVPGSTETTEVQFQDGKVVCNRYPAGFTETVNEAVSKTVATMRGAK